MGRRAPSRAEMRDVMTAAGGLLLDDAARVFPLATRASRAGHRHRHDVIDALTRRCAQALGVSAEVLWSGRR